MAASNAVSESGAATSKSSKPAVRARKRKSRAKPKPVIKELLAQDEPNFRDLVQEYTGGSSSSSSSAAAADQNQQQYSSETAAHDQSMMKTPHASSSCWAGGHIIDGLRSFNGHEYLQASEASSQSFLQQQEWSCAGHMGGSSCMAAAHGETRADDGGGHMNHAKIASAYMSQSLKALETISAFLVDQASPSSASPSPSAACMQEIRDDPAAIQLLATAAANQHKIQEQPLHAVNYIMHEAGSMINSHLAKLLQNNLYSNRSNSCGDQLQSFLSLSCLILVLNQIASKSANGEGLR